MNKNQIKVNSKKFKEWKKAYMAKFTNKSTISYLNKAVYTAMPVMTRFSKEPVPVCIHKPYKLTTSFCFGYDERTPGEYEAANRACDNVGYKMFLNENVSDIKRSIKLVEDILYPNENSMGGKVFIEASYDKISYNCIYIYSIFEFNKSKDRLEKNCHELTNAELVGLLEVLKTLLVETEDRCEKWWKRYGASKLNTWSYSVND